MTQNKITKKYQIFINDKETSYRFYLIVVQLLFVNYVTLYKVDQWSVNSSPPRQICDIAAKNFSRFLKMKACVFVGLRYNSLVSH